MIKKIIGVLATLAILALVVFTALGAGSYVSMLPDDLFTASDVESVEQPQLVEPTSDTATEMTE